MLLLVTKMVLEDFSKTVGFIKAQFNTQTHIYAYVIQNVCSVPLFSHAGCFLRCNGLFSK